MAIAMHLADKVSQLELATYCDLREAKYTVFI